MKHPYDRQLIAMHVLCTILDKRSGPRYEDGSQFDESATAMRSTCLIAIAWTDALIAALEQTQEESDT